MMAILALAVFVQSLPAEEIVIEFVGEAGLILTASDRQLVFDHFPAESDQMPDAIFVTNGNADSFDHLAVLSFMEQSPETPVLMSASLATLAIENGQWPAFGEENWEENQYRYYRSLQTLYADQHAPLNCLSGEALGFPGSTALLEPDGICQHGYVGWDGRRNGDDENVFYVLPIAGRVVAILGNFRLDAATAYQWERGLIPQAEIVVYPATLAGDPEGREFLIQWFSDSYQIAYRLDGHFPESDALNMFGDEHFLMESGDQIVVDFGNQ